MNKKSILKFHNREVNKNSYPRIENSKIPFWQCSKRGCNFLTREDNKVIKKCLTLLNLRAICKISCVPG